MRKRLAWILVCMTILSLCACGKQMLPAMEAVEADGYMAIVWEGRTYIPFRVVSKSDCGKRIGCLNRDTEDIVCEYKAYSPEKWIANYLKVDGGAILFKEEHVDNIPDGLELEYEWNS